MARFHIIYQCEQEDCGATCLAMIMRFYGFRIKPESIKEFCGNMKIGLSMYDLNQAAKRIGFFTQAVRINESELFNLNDDKFPFIGHWNQNHFIIIYKITAKYVYVADPAIGRIKYCHSEFKKGFLVAKNSDGFALMLKPNAINTNEFVKENQQGLNLSSYIKPRWKHLMIATLSLISLSAIGLALPFLTQAIVDNGITNKDQKVLIIILCATLSLAIGRTFFSFIQSRMTLIAGTLIDIELANDLLLRISSLPMKLFTSRKVGDLIQRVSEVSRIGNYISSRVAESILSFVMFCIYGGILLCLYPLIFYVFICGAIIYIVYLSLFLQDRKILDYQFFSAASKSNDELIQYLRGMTELKLACAEKDRTMVWKKLRFNLFNISRKNLILSQKQELGSILIFQIVDAIVIYIMADAVINGNTTLGAMMAAQYIIGSMESPLGVITNFIRDTQSMRITLSRINYIASAPPEYNGTYKMDFCNTSPSLKIKNISFTYDPNQQQMALQNINAEIPSGKTTAIVGMSGSGKTTLLKLLLGFYEPTEGQIFINDKLISEFDLSSWRKNVGAVMQDGYIFSDTIINNVALGDSSPSLERINEALSIACADFVYTLPIGLHTQIGAEGMSLSSGQRQRILLARAIYKRPTVFLLDEATNALDTINERKIYENLHRELKGKTVIIAAHRLSTISNADQILVLNKGQIVECGTHDELIKRNREYANLVQNQRFS